MGLLKSLYLITIERADGKIAEMNVSKGHIISWNKVAYEISKELGEEIIITDIKKLE